MLQEASLDPYAAINNAVSLQVNKERLLFAPEPGEPELTESELDENDAGQEEEKEADQEEKQEAEAKASSPEPVKIESADILRALNRNQDGDAELLIKIKKDRLLYDHAASRFYVFPFGGHHWQEDLTNEALQSLSEVAAVYEGEYKRQSWLRLKAEKSGAKVEAAEIDEIIGAILKRVKALQSLRWKKDILVLSYSGTETLGITGNEWDLDPWLLAVKNGVIDLKTGKLRPGKPEDFIKTAAPTEWKGLNAPCPIWEKFLGEIFGGDKQLKAFVQRLLGYGITGLAILHIFIILWGLGRNGKGTLLELIKYILGELALKTETELLLEQKQARQAGAPNSGVLSLRGRRIVWASETSDGRRLNTGKLKELVGGDTLNARPLFGKHHIQFAPSHLLLLLTNSKPVAPAGDFALWQRVHLIPFDRAFIDNPKAPNESKADPYLLDKLKAEASGILAWLVRGCLEWQRIGLNPPDIVRAATESYKNDEDTLGHFIEDRCILGEACHVRAGELYTAWKAWAEINGSAYLSGKIFGMEIRRRGFDSYHDKQGTSYLGIGLKGDG